jgi:hypothetical protein
VKRSIKTTGGAVTNGTAESKTSDRTAALMSPSRMKSKALRESGIYQTHSCCICGNIGVWLSDCFVSESGGVEGDDDAIIATLQKQVRNFRSHRENYSF